MRVYYQVAFMRSLLSANSYEGAFMFDLLSELIPMFRTENCAFIREEDALVCIGRVEDLSEEDAGEVYATMDVSSLSWLFCRAFCSYKEETYSER